MGNTTTTQSELFTTVRQGLLDFSRSCSVHSPLAAADFFQTAEGAAYYSSGIEYATCNGIIGGNDEDSIPTSAEIDRAIDFFHQRKLPFIWWTPAKNLESRGFQFGGILTGIAVDISEGIPQEMAVPSNVKIKVVQSDAELQAFTQLCSGLGMNENVINQFHAVNSAVMKQGEQVNFLAHLDGIPVGGITLSTCPSSAGVWGLVVLPEYRKQGIGKALVYTALVKAFENGYEHVMAILMPKGMAWGLVTQLGFKEVCQFPFYVYGTSESLEKDEEMKGEIQTPQSMIRDVLETSNKSLFYPRGFQLELLKNCPQAIPDLADWLYEEWHVYDTALTKERLLSGYAKRMNDDKIPITFVALQNGSPVGTVSLKEKEDPELSKLSGNNPWLGSLQVVPSSRGKGLGSALLETAKKLAVRLDYSSIFLYTSRPDNWEWYCKNGAVLIKKCQYRNHPVLVLEIPLAK